MCDENDHGKLIKQYQLLSLCSCYTIIFIHTSPHVSMFALAMPV